MTRVVDVSPTGETDFYRPPFIFAPDGSAVLFVTRRGTLRSGLNHYDLVLYCTAELRRYIDGTGRTPSRHVLASFLTAAPVRHGIDQITWSPDSRHVTFIGRGNDSIGQVYELNLHSSRLSQLTHSRFDIATYAVDWPTRTVIFSAFTPPDWNDRNRRGYAIESEYWYLLDKSDPRDEAEFNIEYYLEHRHEPIQKLTAIPPSFRTAGDISINPSGRQAVVSTTVHPLPARWRRFKLVDQAAMEDNGSGPYLAIKDVFGGPNPSLGQYYLLDMATARAQPLLDVPSRMAEPDSQLKARWSLDGRYVTLPQTYLADAAAEDVVVEVSSRKVQQLPDERKAQRRPITIRVAEDLHLPPQIEVADEASGLKVRLSDLNPQLRTLELGRVEVLEWQDRHGRAFSGGLVYPINYRKSERYGLVIQAGGFSAGNFLLDASFDRISSPYAAQALAGRGLFVLQLPWLNGATEEERKRKELSETQNFTAAVEGVIDALQAKGLIDRERVGLIGFSRQGMRVHYTVAFSSYPIAAATVADSVALTPECYAMLYGQPFPGMSEFDTSAQAWAGVKLAVEFPFWGTGVNDWLDKSYIYHLDRIKAAMRYEHYGTRGESCHWQAFAVLRRHGRPAEMIHLPLADHVLLAPLDIYKSKEGNVDWFDFWLNRPEDPSPAKRNQYLKWRKLRG